MKTLDELLVDIRACRACADFLPLGPRPVLQISPTARILIASQAPGTKVHGSGIPFDDASGMHLREWMGISIEEFYDRNRVAILPMAFCYPGRGPGGDAPPSSKCAPLWRDRALAFMPDLRLTLLVGTYAQAHTLGRAKMTDRVKEFRTYLPALLPLPHPSWRSRLWAARNPWFAADLIPILRRVVRSALS